MLDKIIEYQSEESNLIKYENELSKSSAREEASKIQQVLKSQQAELISLENHAKKTNESFMLAQKKYEEYLKKLEELEKEVENADTEKISFYEKMYKDFVSVGASLEKEISKVYSEVKKINESYEETIKKSKSLRDKFDKHIAVYKKLKSEIDPKIEETKQKMAELEKVIDKKILMIYKQKRDSHIFKVFVPLINNKCGGCRMDISASRLGQMKSNELGIIECENCGRYIYQD